MGSIPGLARSPGEGNGNPFQYSCLKKSMDREAWKATVHEVTKELDMTWTKQQQQRNPQQCLSLYLNQDITAFHLIGQAKLSISMAQGMEYQQFSNAKMGDIFNILQTR